MDVINLDYSIRQAAGLTDKNQIRAAVYAALIVIAKTQNRTPKEQVLMDWLALQVKQTRIGAAQLALAEYDKWDRDPWSYQSPAGYDFPVYRIPPKNSPAWLTGTPNPPVLANESWQSFLADMVSANAWSPLNNPMFTYYNNPMQTLSTEGVIGFPVFGAVLAYQKLYSTAEGVRILADTTQYLSTMSFNLSPLSGVVTSGSNVVGVANLYSQLATLRNLAMQQVAPYAFKHLNDLIKELSKRAKNKPGDVLFEQLTTEQLQATVQRMISGEMLSSFVCSLVLSFALQALIHESVNLFNKVRLRGKLVDNLAQQQIADLPNLGNLLYYDIRGEIAVYPPEYQPTDPVELERLMGSHEVCRAFLLATIE